MGRGYNIVRDTGFNNSHTGTWSMVEPNKIDFFLNPVEDRCLYDRHETNIILLQYPYPTPISWRDTILVPEYTRSREQCAHLSWRAILASYSVRYEYYRVVRTSRRQAGVRLDRYCCSTRTDPCRWARPPLYMLGAICIFPQYIYCACNIYIAIAGRNMYIT